jgi:hypothetical protein
MLLANQKLPKRAFETKIWCLAWQIGQIKHHNKRKNTFWNKTWCLTWQIEQLKHNNKRKNTFLKQNLVPGLTDRTNQKLSKENFNQNLTPDLTDRTNQKLQKIWCLTQQIGQLKITLLTTPINPNFFPNLDFVSIPSYLHVFRCTQYWAFIGFTIPFYI